MSQISKTQSKISARLDAVKKINDQGTSSSNDVYDLTINDLPSSGGNLIRKIDDFKDIRKSKKTQKKDIFSELLTICEDFLGVNNPTRTDTSQTPKLKNKLKQYAKDSAVITLHSSKQIIIDAVSQVFFSGNGVCGSNSFMPLDNIQISPKEFDFLNMLKLIPNSNAGQVMYEKSNSTGFIKLNTELYNNFDSTEPFIFKNANGLPLFAMIWNSSNQTYSVSGLQGVGGERVSEFLNDYFSNIEFPDITTAIQQAMYMTINGDGTEPPSFTVGLNNLDRLLRKLFSICGQKQTDNPLNQAPSTQINEDDEDIEYYFNFDDPEGIDIDAENARMNRVLRFVDCGNFSTPINNSHIEDFVYLSTKNNIDDTINNALNKVATAAYENSGQSIPLENFQISINGLFLLNIPKALISTLLSPKMILPIVLIYKSFNGVTLTTQELMKKLYKLFDTIVKNVFWRFIKVFWSFIKKDLLNFIKNVALNIFKNKLKRWKSILAALIALLVGLLTTNIDSCDAIFGAIITAIDTALNSKVNVPIPGLLLVLSDSLPGYSADKAFMNISERLSASGIPMGPLYGRPNDMNNVIKSIIDGHTEVMDNDSFVKISLKPTVIPSGPGGAVITPLVTGVGKIF